MSVDCSSHTALTAAGYAVVPSISAAFRHRRRGSISESTACAELQVCSRAQKADSDHCVECICKMCHLILSEVTAAPMTTRLMWWSGYKANL